MEVLLRGYPRKLVTLKAEIDDKYLPLAELESGEEFEGLSAELEEELEERFGDTIDTTDVFYGNTTIWCE